MESESTETPPEMARPRTAVVLGLITFAALALSWLGSYALSNVLLSAGLIAAWPADRDPRPLRMTIGFVSLMVVLGGAAWLFRFFSSRQLNNIDKIADD